jgi:hypothetical protein
VDPTTALAAMRATCDKLAHENEALRAQTALILKNNSMICLGDIGRCEAAGWILLNDLTLIGVLIIARHDGSVYQMDGQSDLYLVHCMGSSPGFGSEGYKRFSTVRAPSAATHQNPAHKCEVRMVGSDHCIQITNNVGARATVRFMGFCSRRLALTTVGRLPCHGRGEE